MNDEHKLVAKKLEDQLLASGKNSTVIPVEEFYDLTGRERLTAKFYDGVKEAGEYRHILIAFGENIVSVVRDVEQ